MSNEATFILLVILGALAALVFAEGIRIIWYLIISKRLTNSIKKFERHNPSATTRILFIGDSTGYGTGTSHSRFSIVGRLGVDFPDAHIENCSSCRLSLSGAEKILQAKVDAKNQSKFDVVIIMLGGINLVYCTPMWLVRRTLLNTIMYCKQLGHKVVLISPNNTGLAPLYRFPLSHLYKRRARQFDALYRDVARMEHVHHVSLFQEYSDTIFTHGLFAQDGAHPNDEGYGIWYNQMRMKEAIATALNNHYGSTIK